MAHVDDEIASQPACWRRAVESAPVFEISLPRRGHRVAVVGCGTSWFMAQSYAVLRERAGHGETDAFAASLPLDPATVEQVSFVGDGWTVGLANEAALKCREAAMFWSEAYPAMEYRHGPIAIAARGRALWSLGPPPEGLADQVRETGATFVHSGREPLAELVLAQRFAVALAAARGVDPDTPRHLTRSVVLR